MLEEARARAPRARERLAALGAEQSRRPFCERSSARVRHGRGTLGANPRPARAMRRPSRGFNPCAPAAKSSLDGARDHASRCPLATLSPAVRPFPHALTSPLSLPRTFVSATMAKGGGGKKINRAQEVVTREYTIHLRKKLPSASASRSARRGR